MKLPADTSKDWLLKAVWNRYDSDTCMKFAMLYNRPLSDMTAEEIRTLSEILNSL